MERVGQRVNVIDADVALASFDAAYVGTVQVGLVSQNLLGHASLDAQFPEPAAEGTAALYRLLLPSPQHADRRCQRGRL